MVEHQSHHAHTNDPVHDPDVHWWQPLYSYADLHRHGGSARTLVLSLLAYPFLVPVMLYKSLRHAATHDPHGRDDLIHVLTVAPMRFAIDIAHLNRDLVVLSTTTMPPWRVGLWSPRASAVIEAEAGAFRRWGLERGMQLEIRE